MNQILYRLFKIIESRKLIINKNNLNKSYVEYLFSKGNDAILKK